MIHLFTDVMKLLEKQTDIISGDCFVIQIRPSCRMSLIYVCKNVLIDLLFISSMFMIISENPLWQFYRLTIHNNICFLC